MNERECRECWLVQRRLRWEFLILWFAARILVFAFIDLGDAFASATSPAPTVMLEAGVLEGMYFSSQENEVAFLGVPYAEPPVGDLRWKPPRPANKWTGTRQASRFGPTAPQLPASWLPYLGWNELSLP